MGTEKAEGGEMSKRRQGQKEGDKTKNKVIETKGEDGEERKESGRWGERNKKNGRERKNATVPGNKRREEEGRGQDRTWEE